MNNIVLTPLTPAEYAALVRKVKNLPHCSLRTRINEQKTMTDKIAVFLGLCGNGGRRR